MRDVPVDVIIPIYGAPDHVERCVDSVLRNTQHEAVRFILSDDASPDSRIPALLDHYSADERVVVRRSEENRGFVRNCNAVMRSSTNDVVLLNSDTRVGPGWLRRLQRYAYLLQRVGSVTPMSNNAEVCSAPQWFEPNRYPPSIDVDDLDSVAAHIASYAPIELPTGVGFCLYFRRQALDVVGLFDEQAFGRGYGEENDLCVRMRHAGYLNLLADGVFVQHVGQGSFAGSGELQQNLMTMRERWPGYGAAISSYMANDPLQGIRSRFGLALARRHRHPEAIRPLYLLHYRTRIGRRGGTEYHTQDLIDAAGDRLDPMVLTFESERPIAQWDAGSAGMAFPPAATPEQEAARTWIPDLLDSGIDLVHVQHTKRFPLEVLEDLHSQAKDRSIPMVWSLHDYFTTCPCIQLVHPDGTACPTNSGSICRICDELSQKEAGVTVLERRSRFDRLIAEADLLITPSQSAAETQTRLHGLAQEPMVIPHGVIGRFESVTPPRRRRPLYVVLGYSAPQKGSGYAAALIRAVGKRADWVFLGRDSMPELRKRSNVQFGGIYDREDLQDRLAEIRPDAIVLVSNWAETYLYTLSEAWRSGIPVFGTDIGAMGERLRQSGGGLLLDLEDVETSAQLLLRSTGDSALMEGLREAASVAGASLPTTSQMAERYIEAYGSLVEMRRRSPDLQVPKTTPGEWAGWLSNHTVPFPAKSAYPLRIEDPVD